MSLNAKNQHIFSEKSTSALSNAKLYSETTHMGPNRIGWKEATMASSRTQKGIAHLFLPQTSLRQRYTKCLRNSQMRIILDCTQRIKSLSLKESATKIAPPMVHNPRNGSQHTQNGSQHAQNGTQTPFKLVSTAAKMGLNLCGENKTASETIVCQHRKLCFQCQPGMA